MLRRLTARPRSRAQLAEALSGRGIPADVAEQVLDRFTEVGLIDDAAFAQSWVASGAEHRGLARRALQAELRTKGIDDDLAAAALRTRLPEQEEAAAHELARRRLRTMSDALTPEARMRRLLGLLQRKGYEPELAYRVVREALERSVPAE